MDGRDVADGPRLPDPRTCDSRNAERGEDEGGPANYAYDGANRLTSFPGGSIGWDANGNQTSSPGRTMTWDTQNRMVSCTYGSYTNTFTYGSDGLRRGMTSVVSGHPCPETAVRTSPSVEGQGRQQLR